MAITRAQKQNNVSKRRTYRTSYEVVGEVTLDKLVKVRVSSFGGGGDKTVMGPGSTNPRRFGPPPSINITPKPKPKSDMSQIQAMLNRWDFCC